MSEHQDHSFVNAGEKCPGCGLMHATSSYACPSGVLPSDAVVLVIPRAVSVAVELIAPALLTQHAWHEIVWHAMCEGIKVHKDQAFMDEIGNCPICTDQAQYHERWQARQEAHQALLATRNERDTAEALALAVATAPAEIARVLRFFGTASPLEARFARLALEVAAAETPETPTALRKLLEAQDAAVRALL